MSRLAKKPIEKTSKIDVTLKGSQVNIKGPKGQLSLTIPEGIELKVEAEGVMVSANEKLKNKAFLGLYRSLIRNHIVGVTTGYEIKLTLIGVGYKAAVKGKILDLSLGFSHPSPIDIPEGLAVAVDKGTAITITGIDKQLIGQFAASVRAMKPPEPYKGKGIRYADEVVRKKAGKTAK